MVTIITLISILGVAIGVCALVVVISVMDGADEDLFRKMIDVYAHVRVSEYGGDGIENYEEICQRLDETPGVAGAAPAISRPAVVLRNVGGKTDIKYVQISGIDPEREIKVTKINANILPGGKGIPADKEIVFGSQLARRLGIYVGDDLLLLSEMVITAYGPNWKRTKVKVVGLLESGYYDFDNQAAYVNMKTAQKMYLLDDVAEEIRVSLDDPFDIDAGKERIIEAISPLMDNSFRISGWDDWASALFQALKLEKLALFIILMLVIVVAAFNIIGTQILIVMQKTREIGVMMSMGVSRRSLRRIFLSFGLIIGGVGTLVGVIGGVLICLVIAHTDLIALPEAIYGISRLPVEVKMFTITAIVVSSMSVCALASVFPAWRASRLDPVEALRYE